MDVRKTTLSDMGGPSQQEWKSGALGRHLSSIAVFFVSWCVTYSRVYVNGDDVVHMQGSYGKSIFLPSFKPDWIPNRVFDMYGRNLLVHLFDMIYFPVKSLFGVDFFLFFKIFNATIFSLFILIVKEYVANQVYMMGHVADGRRQGAAGGVLLMAYMAFVILLIFKWVNEVYFVCYQLPAFVGFVVIAELFKLMPSWRLSGDRHVPAPWLAVLAFIAAFTLEAYSGIMLMAVAFALILNWPQRLRDAWRSQYVAISFFLMICCGTALLVTAVYSNRVLGGENLSVARQVIDFFFASGHLSHDAKKHCLSLVEGLVVPGILLVFIAFWRRGGKGGSAIIAIFGLPNFAMIRWLGFLLMVIFPTAIVTAAISLKTGADYFDFRNYPWGGFFLVAELFAVLAISVPLIWLFRGNSMVDTARVFVVAIFLSSAMVRVLDGASEQYEASLKIKQAYSAALTNSVPVFDSGLSLDSVPMQVRPLPTAASPSWFIEGYFAFFKKYYGADTTMLFK